MRERTVKVSFDDAIRLDFKNGMFGYLPEDEIDEIIEEIKSMR